MNFEFNLICKNKLSSVNELGIKTLFRRKKLAAVLNLELNFIHKTHLKALLNFELSLIHENRATSIIEPRIKTYS